MKKRAPLIFFLLIAVVATRAQAQTKRPNVVYFLVDNLGMGELSLYSVGLIGELLQAGSMPSQGKASDSPTLRRRPNAHRPAQR